MTVKELISKAIILLGYNDDLGNTSDARFQISSKAAFNTVYSDVFYCLKDEEYKELSPSDEIPLPDRVVYNVMQYGVAAFIAESLGDADKQQNFMNVYNKRRASLSHYEDMVDDIPYPDY